MTVLDTVKGLIAAHGANAVGAFTVADIESLVAYVEAAEAWFEEMEVAGYFENTDPPIAKARRALGIGLAEKEAGRG